MRLTRNITEDGKCKYAIVRLDKLRTLPGGSPNDCYHQALNILESDGFLEYGLTGSSEECFVLKLKDKFAAPALMAYADAVGSDPEYRRDILELVDRSERHPDSKRPD